MLIHSLKFSLFISGWSNCYQKSRTDGQWTAEGNEETESSLRFYVLLWIDKLIMNSLERVLYCLPCDELHASTRKWISPYPISLGRKIRDWKATKYGVLFVLGWKVILILKISRRKNENGLSMTIKCSLKMSFTLYLHLLKFWMTKIHVY